MTTEFTPDFSCVNCDGTIPWNQKKKIYCGTFCKEQAKDIRWIRGTIIRGVYDDPDVVIARKTRIAHLNAGGYLSLNRRIPIQTRFAVMRKYNHKCATCGKKDVDGTHEVDHIEDSSNSIDNLQLLCIPCHRAKTMANIVSVEENDPRREEIDIHVKELKERVFSPSALKLCDDYGNWPAIETRIRASRKIEFFNHIRDNFLIVMLNEKIFPTHIANRLNETGIPTISGLGSWSQKSVKSMLKELGIKRVYKPSEQTMEYLLPD